MKTWVWILTFITSFSVYVSWVKSELCAIAKALISGANVILISKSLYVYFEWESYFCPFYIEHIITNLILSREIAE